MANPLLVDIPEWKWIKIATGVTTGLINRINSSVSYYQTYRVSSDNITPIPQDPIVGTMPSEAVKIFELSNQELIASLANIDVYIMCVNPNRPDSAVGVIRVDV